MGISSHSLCEGKKSNPHCKACHLKLPQSESDLPFQSHLPSTMKLTLQLYQSFFLLNISLLHVCVFSSLHSLYLECPFLPPLPINLSTKSKHSPIKLVSDVLSWSTLSFQNTLLSFRGPLFLVFSYVH